MNAITVSASDKMSSDAPPSSGSGLCFHSRCGQLVTFTDPATAGSSSASGSAPERRVVAHRSHASQVCNWTFAVMIMSNSKVTKVTLPTLQKCKETAIHFISHELCAFREQ